MRKKLILYFKRRNHARKQWVSRALNSSDSLLGLSPQQMTSVLPGQLLLEVKQTKVQTRSVTLSLQCHGDKIAFEKQNSLRKSVAVISDLDDLDVFFCSLSGKHYNEHCAGLLCALACQ